jgi:hypothetical protein
MQVARKVSREFPFPPRIFARWGGGGGEAVHTSLNQKAISLLNPTNNQPGRETGLMRGCAPLAYSASSGIVL